MNEIDYTHLPKDIRNHIAKLGRIRRDFVANVSHELRTPLTVIRGYLETLINQKDVDLKQLGKIFKQMYQHSLRMEDLIEDLLLLSHLESDQPEEVINTEVDVPTLLEQIKETAVSISAEQHHQFGIKVDPTLKLYGSDEELKSLFTNLIVNAVKYTPANGTITIEWFSKNGAAVFRVCDTGIGIEEKHIPRLTERFYRVDKARSRESGGTGLGLAITKHVLLRHEAELEITSEIGKGSCFQCLFPGKRIFKSS